MSKIVPFERPPRPSIKSCKDCRFLNNPRDEANYWKCGVSGRYCTTEFMSDFGCGETKAFWEPRPPSPPSFWSRLGDAIIERIKGNA